MLYAYAIRYASRCSLRLLSYRIMSLSYNIPYTCTYIVSYRITYHTYIHTIIIHRMCCAMSCHVIRQHYIYIIVWHTSRHTTSAYICTYMYSCLCMHHANPKLYTRNDYATPYEKPKRFTIMLFQVGGWVDSDLFSFRK